MNRWRSQHFLHDGGLAGAPPAVLANAVAVAKALHSISPQLPPIFTLRHLAHEANVPYLFLRAIVTRSNEIPPYKVFALKKRGAGHATRLRYVCVPHPLLLRLQRWIHSEVLLKCRPHEASYAYQQGSRILDMAQRHCGCRWLIKLDIRSFFESILEPDVYRVFLELGYQPLIAFELTRLCTRLRHTGNPKREISGQRYRIWQYADPRIGHLPQGAPTSPVLANLAVRSLDVALSRLATECGTTYTRYADDLVFSTASPDFTREHARTLIHRAYSVIGANGMSPNHTKTSVVPPRARKVVLGLIVDRRQPRLTRQFKDTLRMHVHFLTSPGVGPVAHAVNRGFDSVLGLQHHVFGLAAFAAGIEPAIGAKYLAALREVQWPTASEFPVYAKP